MVAPDRLVPTAATLTGAWVSPDPREDRDPSDRRVLRFVVPEPGTIKPRFLQGPRGKKNYVYGPPGPMGKQGPHGMDGIPGMLGERGELDRAFETTQE